MTEFEKEVAGRLAAAASNSGLRSATKNFVRESIRSRYSYNFFWMGRPVIQYPQDIQAMQEIVWSTKPDVIVETGIAHGGSLVLSASLLCLLDYADAAETGTVLEPARPRRRVIGVDIDVRNHNRTAIEAHPMASRITMIQGSSTDEDIVEQVKKMIQPEDRVMVCLDSNHTHDHVLAELSLYADLVSSGCYCVVFDSVVEQLTSDSFADRPWDVGNNPMTALHEWLPDNTHFSIDEDIENKLQITVAPNGFLRRKE